MQIMAKVCAHREYFGIRENIEAFPVGTRPLAPMKWISVFPCSSI